MNGDCATQNSSESVRLGRAWIFLALAIAIHVLDEALTHFLSVYNPTVLALQQKFPYLPLPTFGFGPWLSGLGIAIVLMLVLAPFAFRGARWIRPVFYVLVVIMIANAAGHTAGTVFGRTVSSVHFQRPMPGFYSSPLLLAASIYGLVQLRRTRPPRA